MNRPAPLLLAGLLACVGTVRADGDDGGLNMESDTLRPLPPAALAVVRAHAKNTDDAECASGGFVGERVDLAGNGRAEDWIAITADGCAWGASSARIWVLRKEHASYRVVLHGSGHSVELARKKAGGLADLKFIHGTARYYNETWYRYRGRRYAVFKSVDIDHGNPDDCRRHRDLAVCQPDR